MKRIKPSLIAAIALTMLMSCSTIKEVPMVSQYSQEFLGKDVSYITLVCGTPTSEAPDGKGGRVLEYADVEAFISRTGTDIVAAKQKAGACVQFFIDSKDCCYSVRTNHLRQIKEYNSGKTWAVVAGSVGGAAVATGLIALLYNIFSRRY